MGVTGLWSLVDSVGHPINLETLHNKVIAIDLSLWVNQSIKGFRGRNGQTIENAHVLGLFHRICKLLFYKIKPVFVFDGKCPELKKNTIAKRAEQRLKAINKSRQSSVKILQNYIASQVSSSGPRVTSSDRLPPLESSLVDLSDNKNFKIYEELAQIERNKDLSEESEDSNFEPRIAHNYGKYQNLESIDVTSDDFKSLPPDVRYEILTEMKQKFKGYRNTDIMPKESNDFSNYQMQRLLTKRGIQSKIEDTIKQLNGEQSEDVLHDWNKKGFHDENHLNAGQLASDENVRFVLLKKSKTNVSENCLLTEESEKKQSLNIASTSGLNEPPNSTDLIEDSNDSCLIMSNSSSSDSEREISPMELMNRTISSPEKLSNSIPYETNIQDILTDNTKDRTNPVLEAFIFEDIVEISDESDVELITDSIKTNDNIDDKISKKGTDNKISNACNNASFTKIKSPDKEESDSCDDFEEVIPEESNEKKSTEMNFEVIDIRQESEESVNNTNEKILEINNLLPEEDIKTSNFNDIKESSESQANRPTETVTREQLMDATREMNKQNRFANHTNEQMMIDCQELLSLFGIPYVVSPTEAEAQCAALEELGLTDGTITDDSDVLLFGAQTVYKNFFTSSKYVELFKLDDIESRFGLTRSSLICIAMLCGSDYTDGVEGVGAVKATEILSEFAGDGLSPLIELKKWWQNKQNSTDKRPENPIRSKLMRLKLSESFPNRVVFDAYMKPTVDTSKERFVWGIPRLDELRDYTRLRFGWSEAKCDQILLPIMKKTQMTIDNYFKIQVQPKDIALVSKRMNKAINKLKGIDSQSQSIETTKSSALAQKVKNQRKRRQPTQRPQSRPKRQQSVTRRPQEINLSESSESE